MSKKRTRRFFRTDYDGAWKRALTLHFETCVLFFFPHIHAEIDWTRKVVFLDNALRAIIGGKKTKNRHADKLVKVFLKNGEERWVLIHIEIQTQVDRDFPRRMFQYYYRAFDRYGKEVVSLAILADENPDWRPDRYLAEKWGCAASLRYPIVKLCEYRRKWDELERSENPFAIVVMAFLKAQDTAKDAALRYRFKIELTRDLLRRGFSKTNIAAIFSVIDSFMSLPDNLDMRFEVEAEKIFGGSDMKFESTLDRIVKKQVRRAAKEEGVKIGVQKGERIGVRKGVRQGVLIGQVDGTRASVMEFLKARFGRLPVRITKGVSKIDDAEKLKELIRLAATAKSLKEFPFN